MNKQPNFRNKNRVRSSTTLLLLLQKRNNNIREFVISKKEINFARVGNRQ